MANNHFTTTLLFDQSPAEVFDAVMNVRGCWSGTIEGSAKKLGYEFTYKIGDMHFCRQKLIELIPANYWYGW